MVSRIPVMLYATDPVSEIGIAGQLRARPEVRLLSDGDPEAAEVAVLVFDAIDEEAVRVVRKVQRNGCLRTLLVVNHLDEAGMLVAIEAGVCGFLRRTDTRPETLVDAIRAAAAGDGTVPPDLLGRLLNQVSLIHQQVLAPRGLSFSGLSEREVEVLRLLSEGHPTSEVARRLCYSERTVKNVLQDMTRRHNLRNRTHAVAYALRQGLI
ncbi:MAG TPA: response regulator transcription factor [Acidimicrobiales bacterium]|nr:response regulator transcription factor [Acidimicrobiales bacterium]